LTFKIKSAQKRKKNDNTVELIYLENCAFTAHAHTAVLYSVLQLLLMIPIHKTVF